MKKVSLFLASLVILSAQVTSIPSAGGGGAPSGAAGGGLAGTYPNPTLANLTTVGAVPYVSVTGILNQDQTANGQLFWDATNHRLGVGTNAPAVPLDIIRPGGSGGIIASFVAPGTGNSYITAGNSSVLTSFGALDTVSSYFFTTGNLVSYAGSAEQMRLASSGNLLIGGTSDGNYKLDVQKSGSTGTVRFFDQTASTGATVVNVTKGAGQTSHTNTLSSDSSASFTGEITANASVGGGSAPAITICGTIGTGSKNTAGFITTATGACAPVLTFNGYTATTGWSCSITNSTTVANVFQQTTSSTTAVTFTGVSGSNDIIRYTCHPY